MSRNRLGQYPVKAHMRELVVGSFSFVTNTSNAPDGLVDPGDWIKGAGVHTSTGLYTFTLNDRYALLKCVCNLETTATYDAQIATVVQGMAAANTIVITTLDEAIAAADTNDLTCTVQIFAYIATS